MIFQEPIVPHPEIAARIGNRVSTLRMMILNPPDGPFVHRIALRIPVGDNMVDNFRSGKSGNLLGRVDHDSGRVVGVFSGVGPNWRSVAAHPDTGGSLEGWTLPCWTETSKIVLDAATAFPGFRIQGWDVAITPNGPTFVELNHRGDFDLLQQAEGRGVADQTFLRALRA